MTSRSPLLVDTRGMRCPWPALRLARAMREEKAVLLVADDPRAPAEIAALAAQHGWTMEPQSAAEATEERWLIRKG
ncbi:sulfurtransferase TusA family protein [Sphingopyxis sp. MWB1]|uniref:sulfurtransferase TusA family protein n=1 Tax=Sphingopyxis sp. MWB1 TaxID=1537715 RepID=UPI0022858CF5|nr:sulfurtransferase TusA family protein [Sphingopyxis sp. MWB1]